MLIIEAIIYVYKYNNKKFTQEYPNKLDRNSKICTNAMCVYYKMSATTNRKALR